MFKLNITHKNTYSEIGQSNPLRWRIMHKEGDVLSSQSGLLKCKDFFNDVVAYKRAKLAFKIYYFDNQIKFNREGLYIHLTAIDNQERFCNNLGIINVRMGSDLQTHFNFVKMDDGSVVICIPHKLWKNTYYISLLSMMIRLCNYKTEYDSWESFFAKNAPINKVETAFTEKAKAFACEKGFRLPVKLRKLWFWAGDNYHSGNQEKPMGSVIHNNGVSNWVQFLKG